MNEEDTRSVDSIQEVSAKTRVSRQKDAKWPSIDDHRNVALNGLRDTQVARVFFRAESGQILAFRTIRNIDISLHDYDDVREFSGPIMSLSHEFQWPDRGVTLLHLRTMRAETVNAVPEATDPSTFEYRAPPPPWPGSTITDEKDPDTPDPAPAPDLGVSDDDIDQIEIDMAALDEDLAGPA